MAETTLQLGFVPKERGNYTSGTNYYKDNVVQYNGSSYIADPVGWSESDPTATYVTIAPTDASGNLNAGWRVFASGNNTFTTGEKVDNVGIDDEPTAGSNNLVESSGVKQSQYPYEAISLLHNTSVIDFRQYEKSEGSFSQISISSPIIWNKDGYNRYHKCVPIPNDKKKVFIQANNNINSRIALSTDYDSSATSGSTISVADGCNNIIVIQAGENVILDIPSNGNYLLVEVNSNSIDESPYSIIFFENDDNKSDIVNNIPFIVNGAITKTSNGNIDTAFSNYRTTDFFLLKKGGAIKVKSDCNPTVYPISVFSAKDASTQLQLESVIGSIDNTVKEYVYINKTSADVYVRVTSHKTVIENGTAYIKVDNFGYTEIPSLLHKRELPKFANLSYDYNGVIKLGSTSASTGYVKIKKDDKIVIKNGSYCHTVMIFEGTYQAGNVVREDTTANRIFTDEMFSSPCDGYLFVRFFDATNVNLPVVIDDFDGTVEIYTLEEQVKKNLLPINIRVATYNTGDFRKSGTPPTYGTDELAIEMRDAIMSVGANLIGTQEDLQYFNTQQESSVYEAIYKMYPKYYREGNTMYNYKGLLGVYDVNGLSKVLYSGSFTHYYFLAGEVNFNGRKTLVVSIHLDWQDRDRRVNQIQQLIDYCKRYEYYIILGDFNPDNCVNGEVPSGEEPLRYEQDLEYFVNAGMNIANANYLGMYTTFYDENIPVYPCDNIVTSPNITIYRIGVEKREYMDDHYIFWSDITIE